LRSKDITLPRKVHTVKAMVFPAVMYRCESWIIKKAEHRSVPWTGSKSNQSFLKEINSEYSLEELILKLKLQYF
ncbi:hypothetical protein L0P53_14500, partial [Holdemanella sp. DFI.5.21]|nr:hypothetical protein [Holdemanella sp. DFI.5.21]